MKELRFIFRGEVYRVNEHGHIKANGLAVHSPTWVFLGGSRHHWSTHIDVKLADAFKDPTALNGCLGWDRDHGTTRTWGGLYAGKLPRINGAEIVSVESTK